LDVSSLGAVAEEVGVLRAACATKRLRSLCIWIAGTYRLVAQFVLNMVMIAVRTLSLAFCSCLLLARSSWAQLRPLDPIDVHAFFAEPVRLQIGVGWYDDQLASLAGVRGELWELADFRATIRTGRMVMEVGGVVQRTFSDDDVVAQPTGGAHAPPADGKRHDSGDYRVATILRLTPAESRTLATLRFGTRLPTTNNREGLDRDAIDFFAMVGAHRIQERFIVSAEAGLAINGTREVDFEQADVLTYALAGEVRAGWFTPFALLAGQHAFFDRKIRGNEDLSEIRAGLRIGRKRWLNAVVVRGLADASPETGVLISAGTVFGRR